MTSPAHGLASLCILLVEDPSLDHPSLQAMLENAGHMTTVWPAGAESCPEDEFDLAIINLPAGRRAAPLAALRALNRNSAAPLPLLAVATDEDKDFADCDGIIAAPPTPDLMAEALAGAIGLGHAPPIIDHGHMAQLRQALAPATLQGLLDTAIRSIDDTVALLESVRVSGNGGAVAQAAHRLTGVAANFGCRALARLAESIERNAVAGTVPWGDLTALATATTAALRSQAPSPVDAG